MPTSRLERIRREYSGDYVVTQDPPRPAPKRPGMPVPTYPETYGDFWSKAHIRRTDGVCWEWQAATTNGYGRYKLDGRLVLAHRHAYELVCGPVPDGLVVRHKCDNPKCINPDHLEVGTYADNARDATERGRSWWQKRGSK